MANHVLHSLHSAWLIIKTKYVLQVLFFLHPIWIILANGIHISFSCFYMLQSHLIGFHEPVILSEHNAAKKHKSTTWTHIKMALFIIYMIKTNLSQQGH